MQIAYSEQEHQEAQRAVDTIALAALVQRPCLLVRNRDGRRSSGATHNALGQPVTPQHIVRSSSMHVPLTEWLRQQHEREYIAMCYTPDILYFISEYSHRIETAARRIAALEWTPSQITQGMPEFIVARDRAVTLERRHNRVPGSVDSSVFYYTAELDAEAFTASIVEMPQSSDYYEPL